MFCKDYGEIGTLVYCWWKFYFWKFIKFNNESYQQNILLQIVFLRKKLKSSKGLRHLCLYRYDYVCIYVTCYRFIWLFMYSIINWSSICLIYYHVKFFFPAKEVLCQHAWKEDFSKKNISFVLSPDFFSLTPINQPYVILLCII